MNYIQIYLKGVLMGACDIIPGVSGGTIAFITGVYERLLQALGACSHTVPGLLFKGKIKEAWKALDGWFLLALGGGIISAVLVLSKLMVYLMQHWAIPFWSFFIGLIVMGALLLSRDLKPFRGRFVFWLLLGGVLGVLIGLLPSVSFGEHPLALFTGGLIAISAMLLPGVSGSFLLLLLGQYALILQYLHTFDVVPLAVFGLGCVFGLLLFSRLLSWALKKAHNSIVSFLIGLMLGSVVKLWPWKEVLSSYTSSKGLVVPIEVQLLAPSTMIIESMIACICGMFAVWALMRLVPKS